MGIYLHLNCTMVQVGYDCNPQSTITPNVQSLPCRNGLKMLYYTLYLFQDVISSLFMYQVYNCSHKMNLESTPLPSSLPTQTHSSRCYNFLSLIV